jgi:hypothetical protein
MNVPTIDGFELSIWDRLGARFLGLFFAAGAAIVDGGAGGAGGDGGAGGAGGGDDGGGAGGDDGTGAGDEGQGDEPVEGEEGQGDEGVEDGEGGEGEGAAQKPLTPEQQQKAIEKSLNKLKETDPVIAKELRKEVFQNREFRSIFPTPQEAQQAREMIDDLGGVDGIAEVKQEVADYAAELTRMSDGDPEAVEMLARDYPDGLAKLTPVALDKLANINPAEYERVVSRHMAKAMFEKGFTHSMDRIEELLGDGKIDQAKQLATAMRNWIKSAEQFGKAAPADDKTKVSAIEKREQAAAAKEQQIKDTEQAQAVTKTMDGIISRHLTPLIKTRNLTTEQKQFIVGGIYSEISGLLKNQKDYQTKLNQLRKAGDATATSRYVGSKVAQIAEKAVKAVWARSGFGSAPARRAGPGNKGAQNRTAGGTGAGANRAVVKLNKKPPAEHIDWSKDRSRMRFISGSATLLKEYGGKEVTWDRDAL